MTKNTKNKRVLVINKQWVLQEQNDEGEWEVVKIQPALNLAAGFYDLSEFSFPKKNKKYIGSVLYTGEGYVFFQSRAEQSRAEQSRAEQSRAEQSRAEQSRAEQSIFKIKSSLFKKTVSVGDEMCLEF